MEQAQPGYYWIANYPRSGSTWFLSMMRRCLPGGGKPISVPVNRDDDDPLAEIKPGRAWRLDDRDVFFLRTHDRDPVEPEGMTCLGGVYLIRHPLDVWLSFLSRSSQLDRAQLFPHSKPLPPGELQAKGLLDAYLEDLIRDFDAETARTARGSWLKNVHSWLARVEARGMCLTRYESLRTRPAESFTSAAGALGLNVSRGEIETKLKQARRVSHPSEQRGGFETLMTRDQIDRFWAVHGASCEALGYKAEGAIR